MNEYTEFDFFALPGFLYREVNDFGKRYVPYSQVKCFDRCGGAVVFAEPNCESSTIIRNISPLDMEKFVYCFGVYKQAQNLTDTFNKENFSINKEKWVDIQIANSHTGFWLYKIVFLSYIDGVMTIIFQSDDTSLDIDYDCSYGLYKKLKDEHHNFYNK